MRINSMKRKLQDGSTVFGTMLFEFVSPGISRIAAAGGADFITFDMEHSGWTFETVKEQIAFARGAGLATVVNPPSGSFENVGRCLDLGADGLKIPIVETAEQAEALVSAMRYPPSGNRGAAFGVSHDDYRPGDDVAGIMANANEQALLMVKLETVTGVDNADAILGVEGVDVGFVGHTDLSVSMGRPGEFRHPAFLEARNVVVAACRKHGKAAGCFAPTPQSGIEWMNAGFRVVTYSGDIWIYGTALKNGLDQLKSARATARAGK